MPVLEIFMSNLHCSERDLLEICAFTEQEHSSASYIATYSNCVHAAV